MPQEWVKDMQTKVKNADNNVKVGNEVLETVKTQLDTIIATQKMLEADIKTPPNPNEPHIKNIAKFTSLNHDLLKGVAETVDELKEEAPKRDEVKVPEKRNGPLSLKEFLKSTLGNGLHRLNQQMGSMAKEDAQAMNQWWDNRILEWQQDGTHSMNAFYRAINWWAITIDETWRKLIMDFMKNPFAMTLQGICLELSVINNALKMMGLVQDGVAKVAWAKPFPEMSKSNKKNFKLLITRYFSVEDGQ